MKTDTTLNEPSAALLEASEQHATTRKAITAPELKAAMAAHSRLGDEIAELGTLRESTDANLVELSASCVLDDEKALLKIARLQILTGLLPARIEARENALIASGQSLAETAANFLGFTLAPKIRAARAAAVEKVKAVLAGHLKEGFLLEQAIIQSESVRAIDSIFCAHDVTPSNPQPHAEKLLDSWEEILRLEKHL